MFKYKIFLASRSPRRRELVHELFKDVRTLSIPNDEPRWQKKVSPSAYLHACLDYKWNAAIQEFGHMTSRSAQAGLIVADTIVVLGRDVLGKPTDAADARRMLKQLSGKTHLVQTGFSLGLQNGKRFKSVRCVVESIVTFHRLSETEIQRYIKTKSPFDKAGAYGFQDQALRFVASIKGSYLNIVGLPLLDIERAAVKLGWK